MPEIGVGGEGHDTPPWEGAFQRPICRWNQDSRVPGGAPGYDNHSPNDVKSGADGGARDRGCGGHHPGPGPEVDGPGTPGGGRDGRQQQLRLGRRQRVLWGVAERAGAWEGGVLLANRYTPPPPPSPYPLLTIEAHHSDGNNN